MKCHFKEKKDADFGQALRHQYAEMFVDYLVDIIVLSLAENFDYRGLRVERLMSKLADEFIDSLNSVSADKLYINTRSGRKEAGDDVLMKDALATKEILNQRVLEGIGFIPDLMNDFDVENSWIEKWRSVKGDYQAAFLRADWYVNWEWRVARVFIGDCLRLMNTIYGFGKVRLKRWYDGFLPYYRKYIELFVGMNSINDERVLYQVKEVKDKLNRYGLSLDTSKVDGNYKFTVVQKDEPAEMKLPELDIHASLIRERVI